ncbi:hypothetical protein FA15DRAFT_729809 [Coprinopsis marcescibilis]|uniref:CxC2-like cysteine cluster KDZ transposase-associated domain-containing protein n=1 Tax=Coprinopsis marcescibilis TaxID=230819 RepID=A0A5C3KEK2_COPMA|nr:hypothetical protein FA15DRAFT_729809 [Coprinopsis marcescibilis]
MPKDDTIKLTTVRKGAHGRIKRTRTDIHSQDPSCTENKVKTWIMYRDSFLDEPNRLNGPAGHNLDLGCSECHSLVPSNTLHRCTSCYDCMALYCTDCIVKQHKTLPFHLIETWNESFFERTSLQQLGLVFNLGNHKPQCFCRSPVQDLLVFDVSGYHTVSVRFCDCFSVMSPRYIQILRARLFPSTFKRIKTAYTFDLLDLFQELNLQAKTTMYDFYATIMNRKDPLKIGTQPTRLNDLHVATRFWHHLKMLQRAGKGHDPQGPSGTKPGELLIEFIYTLFVAIDANFKLKGKERGLQDVELAPGWGAFVEEEGYRTYTGQYIDQAEINTCESEHDAIVRAAVHRTPGYSVTGAGLVICSRNCLIRRNGAGDLQKGERYCNMDYILFSAVAALSLLWLVITYDIACQWGKNLKARLSGMPKRLQVADSVEIEVAIPSWHINGHGKLCQDRFHVGYIEGIGRLCGDEVEQTWWNTNSLGASVREMGPAARHEVLNDHWNAFNFRKVVGFRLRFRKNLTNAITMREKQQDNFDKLSATFSLEVQAEWEGMIDAWNEDKSKPNPYEEALQRTTLQEVRLKLSKEEIAEAGRGELPQHRISVTSFLTTGLEIEEQQRALKLEWEDLGKPTAKQSADFNDKQTAFNCRVVSWREFQGVYTPSVAALIASEATSAPDGLIPSVTMPLYLPSGMPSNLRLTVNRIASMEANLREAQADDALSEICRLRRTLVGLSTFKKHNLGGEGNRANTRLRSVYASLETKIKCASGWYRAARDALHVLWPNGEWTQCLCELCPEHITGPGKEDGESHGKHMVSWIWLAHGISDSEVGEPQLNESLRVEWCRSRARMRRWSEEVHLISEEMRCVVAYLEWKASWWHSHKRLRSNVHEDVSLGLEAYANKQAFYCLVLAHSCASNWGPILKKNGIDSEWTQAYLDSEDMDMAEDSGVFDADDVELSDSDLDEIIAIGGDDDIDDL